MRSVLDNAAAQFAAGQTCMSVGGHADRSGSDVYNLGLSQRRADKVKAHLAATGVPVNAIITEAFGESRPRIDTEDGAREAINRRVEIMAASA
jgi:outer membrane protein OmpA-like peptidoglycan-associated protein